MATFVVMFIDLAMSLNQYQVADCCRSRSCRQCYVSFPLALLKTLECTHFSWITNTTLPKCFNYSRYDNHEFGEYVLYRNTAYNIEVISFDYIHFGLNFNCDMVLLQFCDQPRVFFHQLTISPYENAFRCLSCAVSVRHIFVQAGNVNLCKLAASISITEYCWSGVQFLSIT